uniref:urocanate hydratase n=1 Tax=Macrostomum lignano TaxID=282301 RepID=A0A1I8I9S7_9PLAT
VAKDSGRTSVVSASTAVDVAGGAAVAGGGSDEEAGSDVEEAESSVDDRHLSCLADGLPLSPLPPPYEPDPSLPHAPVRRGNRLNRRDKRLAVRNALRYFPAELHSLLAGEFAAELTKYGHIYMYRFKPRFPIRAYPVQLYPGKSLAGRVIMLMICNNLDPAVAQFPEELVTYGGNGQVFSNWAQFWVAMRYLAELTEQSTLTLHSGHPMGLFPSGPQSPRMIVTNGMMVPNYSTAAGYERLFALGVTQYGQMTAGSFCYIGPQGIVHGTTLTLLNAGRRMLSTTGGGQAANSDSSLLAGRVFVSSGLGGMSGAQAKAAAICGCVGVIAEVSEEALAKRHRQGWLDERSDSLDDLIERIKRHRAAGKGVSIGYRGNVVDVWERLVEVHVTTGECLVDLGSDQTSCHNPFLGGYYPVGVEYEEARRMMDSQPDQFRLLVEASLRRQIEAINYLSEKCSVYFFDYGNAFLLQASRAGADVLAVKDVGVDDKDDEQLDESESSSSSRPPSFRYPSYVQDIMGDIFSLGFGPFRWVCASGLAADLKLTDRLASEVLDSLASEPSLPECIAQQYLDNRRWIIEADSHQLVVGSQARILYSDLSGRLALANAFNCAVSDGRLSGPVVLSRDHHDVSGTDSPFRETSNVYDGSAVCADMAVHNALGDACRGATWVALHNGGGTGWGQAVNGGFGLVLDGSQEAGEAAKRVLHWDVSNGIARRCWSGHPLARLAAGRAQAEWPDGQMQLTVPSVASDQLIDALFID